MKENKLIAEFIGVKPIVNDMSKEDGVNEVYDMYGVLDFLDDIEHEGNHYYNTNTMKFHESWDWLMSVVEMINLLDDYRYTFLISSMDTQIVDNITNDVIVEVSCKHSVDELIKSVYEAVVEFIKNFVSLEKE